MPIPPVVKKPLLGRRTLLTPKVQEDILHAISTGNTHKTAAQYAGIDEDTLCEWLARGRGTEPNRPCEPVYAQFALAFQKAEVEAKMGAVANVRNAVDKQGKPVWVASMTWLERRHYDEWGRHEQHEIVGEGGGPLYMQVAALTSVEVNRLGINEQLALVRAGVASLRHASRLALNDKSTGNGGNGDGGADSDPGPSVQTE